MKKLAMTILAGALLLSGCGKKNDIKAKKKQFEAILEKLQKNGIDINKSKSNNEYLITIKDANKSAEALMHFFGEYDITNENRNQLAKVLHKIKYLKAQVHWQKYANNEPKSVFVYFPGKGDEKEPLKTLLKERTFGAYLTYKNETLKEIDFKDINKTIHDNNNTLALLLKNAKIIINKTPSSKDPSSMMHISLPTLQINGNILSKKTYQKNKVHLVIKNFSCDSNKPIEYLGKFECSLPTFFASVQNKQDDITIKLQNINLISNSMAKNKKVSSSGDLEIGNFTFNNKNKKAPIDVNISKVAFKMDMLNLNEEKIKQFYQLAKNPPKDEEKILQKLSKFVKVLFSNGVTINYLVKIAKIKLHAGKGVKEADFLLKDLSESGNALFRKTIDAKDELKILALKAKVGSEKIFETQNIEINSSVKDLYNFVPEFLELAFKNANKPYNAKLSKEEERAFDKMAQEVVNNGFELSYSPIAFGLFEVPKKDLFLHNFKLDFALTLKQNDYVFQKSVPPLLLLAYLKSDGKLVLPKKDFEKIITKFPPRFAALAMMYAKMEGDNIVYKMEFKQGNLYINGSLIK